jgi:hypothetical protein
MGISTRKVQCSISIYYNEWWRVGDLKIKSTQRVLKMVKIREGNTASTQILNMKCFKLSI